MQHVSSTCYNKLPQIFTLFDEKDPLKVLDSAPYQTQCSKCTGTCIEDSKHIPIQKPNKIITIEQFNIIQTVTLNAIATLLILLFIRLII